MGIVMAKTVVTVLTAMMMLLIFLFAHGKDKATVTGFTFMEVLYVALLWLMWRG